MNTFLDKYKCTESLFAVKDKLNKDFKYNSETSGAAVAGSSYFVYDKNSKPQNTANILNFKLLYGMISDEQKNEQVANEIGAKDGGVMLSRFNEFKKNNDFIANFFLEYLHKFLWNVDAKFAENGNFTDAIVSKITMNQALKELEPVINELNIVNNKLLDLKYNTKLSATVLDHSLKEMKDDMNFKMNPFNRKK